MPSAAAPGAATRLTPGQHVMVLAAFLVLVCVFTYPLITAPGDLLPPHKDPLMYGWAMVSNVQRLLSTPLALFHGKTFYPHGNVMAYTDLVLTPTLTAGPVYLLTANPVLQYNVTLLVWWALSGWAMYVLAFSLFRSHPAAIVAAVAFALCPFRTDFYLEFQMQLGFPIPLAILGCLRYLDTGRWRPLLATVLLVWIEALASMYSAIILGFTLVVLTGLHAILRNGAWGWRTIGRGLAGTALLATALAPFLLPYVQNRRELGLERALEQPPGHAADILTYFETGVTRLYHLSPTGHIAETSLFMGFLPLGLAVAAAALAPGRGGAVERWGARLLDAGFAGAPLLLAATLFGRSGLRAIGLRLGPPQPFFDVMLGLILARLAWSGFWARRDPPRRVAVDDSDLAWAVVFLLVLFFDLSLGPHIHLARRDLGTGLYAVLYPYLLPLHAMRVTSRAGVVVVLAVSLLAGLGMKRLAGRLPGRRAVGAVTGAAVVLVLAEYAPFPLPYRPIEWRSPPAVYRALAEDAEDVAVLEWPLGDEDWDDYFTFMSIGHGKRLVNGASGFWPDLTADLAQTLAWPDSPLAPFPSARARRYLTGIHPLRYVVVHNGLLDEAERAKWARLRQLPGTELAGRFGDDDLYRLSGEGSGTTVERLFSWDYARGRTAVDFRARPVGPDVPDRWLETALNGQLLDRRPLVEGWNDVRVPLAGPRHHSAPNVVTIRWRYRRPAHDERRRIGTTGVVAPVDVSVTSAGATFGDVVAVASVRVNGVDYALDRRGYDVVALDPGTGEVLWTDAFDTHESAEEAGRLVAAIRALPSGTIVAAAVRDEASHELTPEAVTALRTLGAARDIRGRDRISHAIVGVKGAAPGTAVERLGFTPVNVVLGLPTKASGVVIRDFALR